MLGRKSWPNNSLSALRRLKPAYSFLVWQLTQRSSLGEILVSVELGSVGQTPGPGVDGGDGVGGGLLSALVLPVVSGHGAVGSLGFDSLAVGANLEELKSSHKSKETIVFYTFPPIPRTPLYLPDGEAHINRNNFSNHLIRRRCDSNPRQ